MPPQPGTLFGNYEVLSDLGAGGMGEVYKARDLRLGRDVAIKVLPQKAVVSSNRLRRFEQEARAASALNHPNIVTIYEIGEHEGTPYIAMEYVDGVTLREMLAGGALPNDKLVRYAAQMAEGLAKAHQAGIVHRDLKPDNIIIADDGYIKILDFGLAKLLPEGDVSSRVSTIDKDTIPGTILGTVGYMSPEQAKGEPADFRSDQFSLGAVLYEMATGVRAFARDTSAQTLAAVIEDDPEPVTLSNPSVPGHLASVIDRCLSKVPRERYESTWDVARQIHQEELVIPAASAQRHPLATVVIGGLLGVILIMLVGLFSSDIQEWVAGPPPTIDSIAVLPLHNASGDPEQEYFADGMTDALINELGGIHELRVISRTSMMQYKATEKSLPEIGRELNVDAVLEGSVLRSENRVGLTTQLIDVEDDSQLWSGNYERNLEDVLVLRKEVARAIVEEIRIVLTPEERAVLASAATVDAEAYDAYQRGVFFLRKFTEDGVRRAIDYAEESLRHQPDFALGHVLRAWGYSTLTYVSRVEPTTLSVKARDSARRALSLDEELAEAHSALAWIQATHDWDWTGAEASYQRALELEPGLPGGTGAYAHFLAAIGRFDDSIRQARRSEELDPVNPNEAENLAFVLYMARRFDESVAEARSGLELHPDHLYLHVRLARALEAKGQLAEAIEVAQEAHRMAGGDPDRQAMLARLYAVSGRREEALEILQQLEVDAEQSYVPPTAIARVYVGLGEMDRALDLLEQGYEMRDGDMYLLKTWPVWDPLRGTPRFQDLLRRMNFPD